MLFKTCLIYFKCVKFALQLVKVVINDGYGGKDVL
jgi:hypothetical protein